MHMLAIFLVTPRCQRAVCLEALFRDDMICFVGIKEKFIRTIGTRGMFGQPVNKGCFLFTNIHKHVSSLKNISN